MRWKFLLLTLILVVIIAIGIFVFQSQKFKTCEEVCLSKGMSFFSCESGGSCLGRGTPCEDIGGVEVGQTSDCKPSFGVDGSSAFCCCYDKKFPSAPLDTEFTRIASEVKDRLENSFGIVIAEGILSLYRGGKRLVPYGIRCNSSEPKKLSLNIDCYKSFSYDLVAQKPVFEDKIEGVRFDYDKELIIDNRDIATSSFIITVGKDIKKSSKVICKIESESCGFTSYIDARIK